MFASTLAYAGLVGSFLGLLSLIVPLRFLRIRTRGQGGLLLMSGLLLLTIGWALPAKETKVAQARTRLDEFTPVYQFSEVHSIRVNGSKDRSYQAIRSVTADEIFLFRTLTWIRRFGRSRAQGILNPPEHQPLLDVALRGGGFTLLAEEPGREIVIGEILLVPPEFRPKAGQSMPTAEQLKSIRQPGFATATMNFLVEDTGDGHCIVQTETRVYATDGSARRRFAPYWRMIYPGSALIRRMWLRAIKNRAETRS